MAELPISGRRYQSSFDAVHLVPTLIEMKQRVEREMQKRGVIMNIPQRIHDLADAVAVVLTRYRRRNFTHFESEEGYIREFGEWLIRTHAEITHTTARAWEHEGVPFNVLMLREQLQRRT